MKDKKFKINKIRVIRAVSQLLFFIFLPALYISAFSGIKAVYMGIYNHSFSFGSLLPQIVEAAAIIPVTVFTGRFFCGWMCAFGSLQDFSYALSLQIFNKRLKINEKLDGALKYIKYIWLCFLIIAVWSLNLTLFSNSNPWDAFGMLLTLGKVPDFSYVVSNLLPALIFLIFIIAASFFVERFFCRYLCPLGAVFAIISKLRLTSIIKPKANCGGKCRVCTLNCPMGIALYKEDSIKSGECINCLNCVSACPRKNAALSVSGNDVRPVIAGAAAVATMTGIYYAGSFTADTIAASVAGQQTVSESSSGGTASQAAAGSDTAGAATQASSSSVSSKYKDGTYTGSGTGFKGGTTTVSVTVKSGKITDVSVVSSDDTPQFLNRAYSVVAQSIINEQTADVDAVSGATYSSLGIMEAVADALGKAS